MIDRQINELEDICRRIRGHIVREIAGIGVGHIVITSYSIHYTKLYDPKVSAIDNANTPFIDSLYVNYPNATLRTDGLHVGLPEGQMGNSEVGHIVITSYSIHYTKLYDFMKNEGYGRIVNIISTSVKEPIPGLGVSNTTRGAVGNWSKTLSIELGSYNFV